MSRQIPIIEALDTRYPETSRVKHDRYLQLLGCIENGIKIFIRYRFVQSPGRKSDADETKIIHRPPQLPNGLGHIAQRQNGEAFESIRGDLTIGVKPIVIGPSDGASEIIVFYPAASTERKSRKECRYLYTLNVHVF